LGALFLEAPKGSLEQRLFSGDDSCSWQQEAGVQNHNFLAANFYGVMLSTASDLFTQGSDETETSQNLNKPAMKPKKC